MKKSSFKIVTGIYICMCLSFFARAQTLSPDVVATAGDHFELANGENLDWTLGEIMVETFIGQTLILTQGFHQSYDMVDAWRNPRFDFQIKVFPNPTRDWLYFETDDFRTLSIELVDMAGRVLLEKSLSQQGQFYMGNFADGLYLLRIYDGKNTFRVLKINKSGG